MKWIKHMTNANKDDKLVNIRANFGMWGIGVYWTIVELVAEQIVEKSERAEATLIISELLGLFGCKRNKLDSFLEHSANVSLMKTVVDGNMLHIDIPKILDFADNYIKYDGKSLKSLQRHFKESSKQEEKRREEEVHKNNISTKRKMETRPKIVYSEKRLHFPEELLETINTQYDQELVTREILKMENWLLFNKPKKDYNRFVANWLNRAKEQYGNNTQHAGTSGKNRRVTKSDLEESLRVAEAVGKRDEKTNGDYEGSSGGGTKQTSIGTLNP